jgi:hypothetical protein
MAGKNGWEGVGGKERAVRSMREIIGGKNLAVYN